MVAAEASAATLDILADLDPRGGHYPGRCRIAQLREEQPDLAEQYDRVMATNRYGDRTIANWFTQHGFEMGLNTVARHRRKECVGCQKTS